MNKTRSIISRFPDFYTREEESVLFLFTALFGQVLEDAEHDLLRVMRAHWVDKANNEGSQGFNAAQKGDLDKIFTLYLESLGGTSQLNQINRGQISDDVTALDDAAYAARINDLVQALVSVLGGQTTAATIRAAVADELGTAAGDRQRVLMTLKAMLDDALYRGRIKGLIQVLMGRAREQLDDQTEVLISSASSRLGIRAIVAANLGIVENPNDTAEQRAKVQAAREAIRIIEYAPDASAGTNYVLTLYQPFTIHNPNLTPVTPQLRITLHDDLPVPLANLTLINSTTNEAVSFFADVVEPGDVLNLFADGTALRNGVNVPLNGQLPEAAPGDTEWRIEALLHVGQENRPVGRFDTSRFDQPDPDFPAGWMFSSPALTLNVSLTVLTPGFFTVYIPWDIPGFTDKFDELSDHPRTQIGYIVSKVKAAGVGTAIVYEKAFSETHALSDALSGSGVRDPFTDDEEMDEFNFDIGSVQEPYPGGIDEELDDHFIASGVFDYTAFDSLNTFG